MDEPGGGAEEVEAEGPAEGWEKDKESRSSSSAWLDHDQLTGSVQDTTAESYMN